MWVCGCVQACFWCDTMCVSHECSTVLQHEKTAHKAKHCTFVCVCVCVFCRQLTWKTQKPSRVFFDPLFFSLRCGAFCSLFRCSSCFLLLLLPCQSTDCCRGR